MATRGRVASRCRRPSASAFSLALIAVFLVEVPSERIVFIAAVVVVVNVVIVFIIVVVIIVVDTLIAVFCRLLHHCIVVVNFLVFSFFCH